MKHDETRAWSGTVCVGISETPWPFGKLTIGPEAIEVRSLTRRYTLLRKHVLAVERAGIYPWGWFGIRIRHACEGCPRFQLFLPILFWRRSPMLRHAKSLGYHVP